MKKVKKPFNQTIFGKIVGKAGNLISDVPGLIAKAASGNPLGAIADVVAELTGKKGDPKAQAILNELMLEMKKIELEFAKIDLEETIVKEENVTKRWDADMHSDSWLSKNARPIGFCWALIMVTMISICSWASVELSVGVLTLVNSVIGAIVGGYFILRTVEKRNSKKYNN